MPTSAIIGQFTDGYLEGEPFATHRTTGVNVPPFKKGQEVKVKVIGDYGTTEIIV